MPLFCIAMLDQITISPLVVSPLGRPSREVVELNIRALKPAPWNLDLRPYKVYRKLNPVVGDPSFYGLQACDKKGKLVGVALASEATLRSGVPYFLFAGLYVDPSVHKGGIGRQLVQRVLAEGKARGLDHVYLGTLKGSPAEAFYLKMGFEKFEAPWLKDAPDRQGMRFYFNKASTSPKA